MRWGLAATALPIAAALAACGSTHRSTVALSSASTCMAWAAADPAERHTFIKHATLPGVKESAEYRAINNGCAAAVKAGRGSQTTLAHAPEADAYTASERTTSATSPTTPSKPAVPPPDFVSENEGEGGDKVKLEGRFGRPLLLSETDADQAAVAECQGADKREMTVRLDLTITVQSSLPLSVVVKNIKAPTYGGKFPAFLMGYTNGPSCHRETTDEPDLSTQELQPNEPDQFTMWIVLGDVVTPNDHHPSLPNLAKQKWLIEPMRVTMDNQVLKQVSLKGPRVAECQRQPEEPSSSDYRLKELNVIAGMPRIIPREESGVCAEHNI